MKSILYILLLPLILISCQHALEKPENLLSKEEMSEILTDIYLYKQHPDAVSLSPESNFDTYINIFKKYNITKERFQESFTYYYANSGSLLLIYDDVIKNLEDKLNKEQLDRLREERSRQEQLKKNVKK